ncbi:sugar ABC transporter substrate-binding protein [Rhodobacter sp. KR11]|uniref:ABC transporter substrate-binding protein n=1 Tax=Rhodobacter sp. KR11 TaxID=2974588 RepID=UPI0022224F84|nr:sugar ABC transporter substrate-binding protein [Rhodobacter sp. KR11]MCW1917176.1 sugar ABC transporter substrate-binding protein [Rhodobacter sp. KR11]
MYYTKTLAASAALLCGTVLSAQAEDITLSFIMCGDIRPADQATIDKFQVDNPGIKVAMEAVPWGTCQDKSMQLAAAGNPVSVAYMGSRTLLKLSSEGLIVPAEISDEAAAAYQPGVLKTVSSGGKYWGYPHAFSTKGLYINCDLVTAAGLECKAPATWADMITMAKAIKEKNGVAGIGIAGKDFDNTMHMFLDFLYSNGGSVLNAETGEVTLDSQQTRETLQMYADILPYGIEGATAWERDQMKDLFNDGKLGMYVNGPWGWGQHKDKVPNQILAPVPAGPSGASGTILITDSIAVFKQKDPAVEAAAQKLAQALTSGAAQYDLDKTWGLTPILDYTKLDVGETPYYVTDANWKVFVDGIASGGPEPLVTDFKSLQGVFTNMIQGVMLGEGGTVDELVTQAAAELADVK